VETGAGKRNSRRHRNNVTDADTGRSKEPGASWCTSTTGAAALAIHTDTSNADSTAAPSAAMDGAGHDMSCQGVTSGGLPWGTDDGQVGHSFKNHGSSVPALGNCQRAWSGSIGPFSSGDNHLTVDNQLTVDEAEISRMTPWNDCMVCFSQVCRAPDANACSSAIHSQFRVHHYSFRCKAFGMCCIAVWLSLHLCKPARSFGYASASSAQHGV
jgi:hypothetical protein